MNNNKDPNSVCIRQLELLARLLPIQQNTIEKTIAAMKDAGKTELLTSNWKSSGLRAMELLQRFTSGIAGILETEKAELLWRELEATQPVEVATSQNLTVDQAIAKHPNRKKSATVADLDDATHKPKRRPSKK